MFALLICLLVFLIAGLWLNPMAIFKNGPRWAVQYVPPSNTNAGDVVVINELTYISDVDNPVGAGLSIIQSSLYIGGVYQVNADAAYAVGTYVYWNPTVSQVTTAIGGTVPFGWIVGDANGLASGVGSSGAAGACFVLHDPEAQPNWQVASGAIVNDNISNTAAETAFATTATIPSGTLEQNDVVTIKTTAIVTAQNSTNTNRFKLKILTAANTFTALVDSTALNLNSANAVFTADVSLTFPFVGNSGGFYTMGTTAVGNSAPAPTTVFVGNTAINTNEAITIEVTDTQSAANTGNVAQLILLDVAIKRK